MEKCCGPHGMLGAIHVLFLVQWLSAPAKNGLFCTHSLAYKCHVFLFSVRFEEVKCPTEVELRLKQTSPASTLKCKYLQRICS
jgi:hypothetical protein